MCMEENARSCWSCMSWWEVCALSKFVVEVGLWRVVVVYFSITRSWVKRGSRRGSRSVITSSDGIMQGGEKAVRNRETMRKYKYIKWKGEREELFGRVLPFLEVKISLISENHFVSRYLDATFIPNWWSQRFWYIELAFVFYQRLWEIPLFHSLWRIQDPETHHQQKHGVNVSGELKQWLSLLGRWCFRSIFVFSSEVKRLGQLQCLSRCEEFRRRFCSNPGSRRYGEESVGYFPYPYEIHALYLSKMAKL